MDRDDVTSAGLTAIGILAGAVAQAVAVGGRLVAAGLGTIENALRGGEEGFDVGARSRAPWSTEPSDKDSDEGTGQDDEDDEGFARLSEPAFEPADGVTPPARPARSAIRRSSAGAAARTAPGPRPAKRATAKSLPPNLRPVETREPAPVKGAAGAADAAPVPPAKTAKATARTATAEQVAAKKASAKKASAKSATAKTATARTATAKKATAKTATAKKATAKKATAKKAASKRAVPSSGTVNEAPAGQAPPVHSAESAHTRPEGTTDAGGGSVEQP